MNRTVLRLARQQAISSLRSPEWRALLAALLVADASLEAPATP